MTNKRINANKGSAFEKSLTSFGRWFCGLDESANTLNLTRGSNFNEPLISDPKTWQNSSRSNLRYSRRMVARKKNSGNWFQSLGQSFTSWCADDWLQPLPGLSVVSELSDSPVTNIRNRFFKHGSDFLRYKQESVNRKCSRLALFLAGTAMSRSDALVQSSYAPKKFVSSAVLGSSLSSGAKNRSYSSPSYQWALESYVDPAANIANAFQVPTVIAVALPLAISTVQVLSSLNAPLQRTETKRDAIAPEALDVQPPAIPEVPTTADIAITLTPPTGKVANIQNYTLPAKGEFTSEYGWRWGRVHRGIDIAGPVGTPIVAAAAGKVISAGWNYDGFGYRVEIEHPDKTVTLYAHNSKVLVKPGQHVRQGTQIAEMGSTGNSTGPHLHFQIHPRGKEAVNPSTFLGKQLETLPTPQ